MWTIRMLDSVSKASGSLSITRLPFTYPLYRMVLCKNVKWGRPLWIPHLPHMWPPKTFSCWPFKYSLGSNQADASIPVSASGSRETAVWLSSSSPPRPFQALQQPCFPPCHVHSNLPTQADPILGSCQPHSSSSSSSSLSGPACGWWPASFPGPGSTAGDQVAAVQGRELEQSEGACREPMVKRASHSHGPIGKAAFWETNPHKSQLDQELSNQRWEGNPMHRIKILETFMRFCQLRLRSQGGILCDIRQKENTSQTACLPSGFSCIIPACSLSP